MNYKKKGIPKGTLIFYALLLLLAWVPLPLASNRPWAWGVLNVASYLLLFCTLFTYSSEINSVFRKFKIPIVLFAVFIMCVLAQLLPIPLVVLDFVSPTAGEFYAKTGVNFAPVSIDSAQTEISLFKSISYFSLFLCTLFICDSTARIKVLLLTVVALGTFQAMYGALEVLLGLPYSAVFNLPVKSFATGTFVYKNHFANYLMLCLSLGVGYLVSTLLKAPEHALSRQRLRSFLETLLHRKALVRVALAIMVVGLVMSHSRMGNTAFFSAMTLVGISSLFLIKKKSKGLTILIISMFIVDMFILSAWFGLDKVKTRLEQTSFSQESRDEVIRDSIPLLKDFVVTGSGMGSYYGVFPKYQGKDIQLFYDHAHNDYLQFAIELGVLATAILFFIPLLAAKVCYNSIKDRRNTLVKGTAFGCLMALIGMAIHMSVDFPLQAPANVALFSVILGLAFQTSNKDIKK